MSEVYAIENNHSQRRVREDLLGFSADSNRGLIGRFAFQPAVNDELVMLRLVYSLIEILVFGIKRSVSADANTDERICFRSESDDARLASLLIIFATL